jgi:hypothetical protein
MTGFFAVNRLLSQEPVISLPFNVPFPFKYITHRGLSGDRYQDISMAFVFLITAGLAKKYTQQ